MKKSVNTRCKFNKCTKVCHTCNLASYYITYCKFLICCKPWILLRELQRKGNLVTIDIFDQNSQLLSNCEYFLRILNSAPGHLRNVKKSVSSAKINKCTEICNILNNAFYLIANMDLLHKLFLFLSLLSNQKLLAITNNTTSSRIKLSDHKLDLLSCIFGQILLICVRYQAGRNKYSCLLNIHA